MDYSAKLRRIAPQTLLDALPAAQQYAVRCIASRHLFTQQELKIFVEFAIDLAMWDQGTLPDRWIRWRENSRLDGRAFKKWAFANIADLRRDLTEGEVEYSGNTGHLRAYRRQKIKKLGVTATSKIFGKCPVYSEKTRCCNLYTIDAVKNCGYGCSYCSIQTMYTSKQILIDDNFRDKLDAIALDPRRRYHIGTGQSSDALMWGNLNGILDDVLDFARKWPNALIEFKTKSNNVKHFFDRALPRNIVCSWSLNPDAVIRNEEHFTPALRHRLDAARAVADKGVKVAFHLHPMVCYGGWADDYAKLIGALVGRFDPREVLFVSFGALTFPKPIMAKIRNYGIKSKIHQMRMVANPEGKLTCPDDVKIRLFRHAYDTFAPWHQAVFFYLCMEEERFWQAIFGHAHIVNQDFERELLARAWAKLRPVGPNAAGRDGP